MRANYEVWLGFLSYYDVASRKLTLANKGGGQGGFALPHSDLRHTFWKIPARTSSDSYRLLQPWLTLASPLGYPVVRNPCVFDFRPQPCCSTPHTQLTCLTDGLNWNSPASFRSSQIIGIRGTASIAAGSTRRCQPLRCPKVLASFCGRKAVFQKKAFLPNNCVMYPFTLKPEAWSLRDVAPSTCRAGFWEM